MTEYIDTTATSERGTLRPLTGAEQWDEAEQARVKRANDAPFTPALSVSAAQRERDRRERDDMGEPVSGRDALWLSAIIWGGMAAWGAAAWWWLA